MTAIDREYISSTGRFQSSRRSDLICAGPDAVTEWTGLIGQRAMSSSVAISSGHFTIAPVRRRKRALVRAVPPVPKAAAKYAEPEPLAEAIPEFTANTAFLDRSAAALLAVLLLCLVLCFEQKKLVVSSTIMLMLFVGSVGLWSTARAARGSST